MSRARRIAATLRPATVIAVGAVGVHQLRYLAAYGGDASQAMDAQGHAYLDALLPVLALFAGLTVLGTIAGGLAGVRSPTAHRAPAIRVLLYAGAILVAFGTQEVLEGVLFAGHPAGFAAIAANGGFVAIPLALAAGWTALIAVRGLEDLELHLGRAARPRRRRLAFVPAPSPFDFARTPEAVASAAAPRAPPTGLVQT